MDTDASDASNIYIFMPHTNHGDNKPHPTRRFVPANIWEQFSRKHEEIDHSLYTDICNNWIIPNDGDPWNIWTTSQYADVYPIHLRDGSTAFHVHLDAWKHWKSQMIPHNPNKQLRQEHCLAMLTMKKMVSTIIDKESRNRCDGCINSRSVPQPLQHTCLMDRRHLQETLFDNAVNYVSPPSFKTIFKRNGLERGLIVEHGYLWYHYITTKDRNHLRDLVIEPIISSP